MRLLALAFVAMGLCGCATTGVPLSTALPDTHLRTGAPAGFNGFCVRFPAECTPHAPETAKLDDRTWRLLNDTNRSVNAAIWPMEDATHYGRTDYWTIPTDGYGDCEDYALTKRKALEDAGLPPAALRLAVVYSRKTGPHAVLTVSTDKGALVLDNMNNTIAPWREAGYIWIEAQDAANPRVWETLETAVAQVPADGEVAGTR